MPARESDFRRHHALPCPVRFRMVGCSLLGPLSRLWLRQLSAFGPTRRLPKAPLVVVVTVSARLVESCRRAVALDLIRAIKPALGRAHARHRVRQASTPALRDDFAAALSPEPVEDPGTRTGAATGAPPAKGAPEPAARRERRPSEPKPSGPTAPRRH